MPVKKIAGKKTAKKKATKKTAASKKKGAVANVTITYSCNGTCNASDEHASIHAADVVWMVADGTHVRIKFKHGSPFVSGAGGTTPINIAPGGYQDETAKATKKHYDYKLSCRDANGHEQCPRPVGDPEMIIN